MKFLLPFAFLCCVAMPTQAQSYMFGVKGGPSIGTQKWNGFTSREPLVRYHAIAFIESYTENSNSALFLQAGYHIRGSALRVYAYYDPVTMRDYKSRTSNMQFKNVSLSAGAKKRFDFGVGNAYYLIGLRGEYTVDTKMGGYLQVYEGLENKFLFGALFGGGYELPFGKFVSGVLEASVSPDFSKQIYLPRQATGLIYQNGQEYILPEQNVTNVSFEISLGLRFLREITYYD